MGVIIDMQTRRLGFDMSPVQEGMETVAHYLETELPLPGDAHDGYGIIENEETQRLAVGRAGLRDFRSGFEGILGDKTESTAAFAYGAYFAGRILLPEVVMQTPVAARRFSKVVDQGIKQHPEADFPEMAEYIAARTAASISLMALWGTIRECGPEVRLAFSRRVNETQFPPSNKHIATAFKHRLDERTVFRLLDKPIPNGK